MSLTEEGEDGFIRLVDRVPDNPPVSAGKSPQLLVNNGSGIHVRTDFYVGAHDEGVTLHDVEAGGFK